MRPILANDTIDSMKGSFLNIMTVVILVGCYRISEHQDENRDEDNSNIDSSSDPFVDSETDTTSGQRGTGVWCDSTSGLYWQNPPYNQKTFKNDAIEYCGNLSLDNYDDWRLPKIQELITLIRGCDSIECGVTDPGCLEFSCGQGADCRPCSPSRRSWQRWVLLGSCSCWFLRRGFSIFLKPRLVRKL